MIATLICKKREFDGKKWINFSFVKNNKWYSVKFVKDCAAPQIHKIDEGIHRSFIELTATDKFDMKNNEDGKNVTIFVESYSNLSAEALAAAIAAEKKKLEEYRAAKEKEKMSFLLPTDDKDMPF